MMINDDKLPSKYLDIEDKPENKLKNIAFRWGKK